MLSFAVSTVFTIFATSGIGEEEGVCDEREGWGGGCHGLDSKIRKGNYNF